MQAQLNQAQKMETVDGMLKMLRRLIGEDIDLAWLPGKNLWQVMMDPSQIDQILANLCINARDAISGVGKAAQTQKEDSAESAAHGNETILLVEDGPVILKMTTMMLEHLGYTLVAAKVRNTLNCVRNAS